LWDLLSDSRNGRNDLGMQRLRPPLEDLALEAQWLDAASIRPRPRLQPVALGRPIGHSGWAALFGAVTGAFGGFAMLAVAEYTLHVQGATVNLPELLSILVTRAGLDLGSARHEGFAAAIVIGALLGAPLGYLARRLVRIVPRVLFFAILAPVAWIFVQACIMGRLTPGLATLLPFGPLVLGALAYGLCIALVPPIREQVVAARSRVATQDW
jgi:hypothetical protein